MVGNGWLYFEHYYRPPEFFPEHQGWDWGFFVWQESDSPSLAPRMWFAPIEDE